MADEYEGEHVARGMTGTMMKAFGAGEWPMTVTEVVDVTDHYRRLSFHAPGFFEGTNFGPATFLRLWAPDPDKPGREHQRGYTIAEFDEDAETLVLEFVLHTPSGPAAKWAAQAKPGDVIVGTRWGAPRFDIPDPAPTGYLLVGDPAALPAINGILGVLPPAANVEVLLEYTHDSDQSLLHVPQPGTTRVTWVRRTGDTTLLASALPERDYSNWFAWVTPESAALKAVKEQLRAWGFPRATVKSQGYWTQDKAMGKSRGGDETKPDVLPAYAATQVPESATGSSSVTLAAPESETATTEFAPKPSWRRDAGNAMLRPLRGRLIAAAIAQAFVSLLQLAPFVLLAELCRRLLDGQRATDQLMPLVWWAVALLAAGTILQTLLLLGLHRLDASFGHDVRSTIVQRLGHLPLGWFDKRTSGNVKKAVDDDAASLHYLVTHAVIDLTAAIVTPLAVLIYLFTVSVKLAVVLLLPLFVYYVLGMRLFSAGSYGVVGFEKWRSRISSESISYLDGFAVSRVYDSGEVSRLRTFLRGRSQFIDGWQRPLVGAKTLVDLVTRPTTYLMLIATVGGLFVIQGWLDPADLLSFLFLGVTFGAQLLAISYGAVAVRDSLQAAGRIGWVLTEPTLVETEAPKTLESERHTVQFEDVCFAYRAGHRVLDGIDLTLKPGTMTALVGPSGSGKSTIASLLARFYDVESGAVTIDGVDIRQLSQDELYRTVGFVFQGAPLVDGTLRENIVLGRPDATKEDVVRAARAAQIHDRIMRLDRGYDAVVGADGRLSGGEIQRIAIARVLLADPPILVLDEATSYADPESEHLIQAALSALVADRTVLVIAHRLHTVTGADAIAVLDHGRLAQLGTHRELLDQPGRYQDLWRAGGYADLEEAIA